MEPNLAEGVISYQ